MIYINHEKKAIFIHIPKTGGSYIGPTLVKYYGFTSFLSILNNKRPDHDIICKTKYFKKVSTNNHIYDNSFFNKMVGILLYCKTSDYLNEQMNMNTQKWREYTKFCFVRNPYDRVISGWKHFNIIFNRNSNDLHHYLAHFNIQNISNIEYGHIFMSQKRQIQDEFGNCGVDLIGRFEYLENDFCHILNKIGFNNICHVEKKENVSSNKNIYLNINKNTVKIINELFKDDFESFHYTNAG